MLLKITERCSMGCTHCLNRAGADGAHMDFATLKKAVKKINDWNIHVLMVTGGEPTEHPDFMRYMKYLSKNLHRLDRLQVIVTTNGLYFEQHLEVAQRIHNMFPNLYIQVTNDPRFYPIDIDESNILYRHKYISVCRYVDSIVPQGRAADNHIPTNRIASNCINCRSLIHQLTEHTIEADIAALEADNKFCTPSIGVDGMLRAGESSLCPPFASIDDDDGSISQKLLAFRCNRCAEQGLNRNIPEMLKTMLEIG